MCKMKPKIPATLSLLSICLYLLPAVGLTGLASAQSLEERLMAEKPAALAAEARRNGDPLRGATIFYGQAMACSTCHGVGDRPATLGPDLARMDPATSDAALVEAILEPSKTIAKGYAIVSIETTKGEQISGTLVEDSPEHLVLRDAAQQGRLRTLRLPDIKRRQDVKVSTMPAGQVNQLAGRPQFLDLVSYLINLREGGLKRARELQPPPDPLAKTFPDIPLPWRPVVQRGEVEVPGNTKYPRAVAMGFAGGTVLFDADRLGTVAVWFDGFVKSSPQNYFGLYWKGVGSPAEWTAGEDHPLRFQLSDGGAWQAFEPPTTSDPNTGTRFEGFQVGPSTIRLKYQVLVGQTRIRITEDVRAERRSEWSGFSRAFNFAGLPAGARVSLALPAGEAARGYAQDGMKRPTAGALEVTPLVAWQTGDVTRVVRGDGASGAAWQADDHPGRPEWQLVSAAASGNTPTVLRLDAWKYTGGNTEVTAAERASLVQFPPELDRSFEKPRQAAAPLPTAEPTAVREKPVAPSVNRPAVNPQENIDEFPSVQARYLRFVVSRVSGNAEPGIDELEVYGKDPKLNLALAGKASASSVIPGYPIHQIPHLNDGKFGNAHSWISHEGNGGWAQIEFPEPTEVNKIVWARDRTGVCKDRLAVAYRIEVSDDGKKWSVVGDESGREASSGMATPIRRAASPGYVIEALPAPFPGCRPSDIAFDENGTMYAIAMTKGQIWRTRTPPVGHPDQVKWQRFATGLYHPIGLAVVEGRLYVAQKQEITELIDRDGDGVVDEYRTVATGWGLSTGWHEYCFGLAVDPEKNLWFALNTGFFWTNPGYVNPGRWRGSVMRVAYGTEKLEEVAKGCRVPNGIAQGPDGNIFFTDNQGDWIQACKLAHVVPGRFYGHPETKPDALPKDVYPDGRSAIWLPYDRSRSTAAPVHDSTKGGFGPFANQMFLGDVGYGANPGILRVALEKVNGEYQGACFRFVDGQPQGCERMTFGPDNQLYMASLTSGLTRMAFEGPTPLAIHSVHIRPRGAGFVVQLTKPLAADALLAATQFRVKRYHYLYTGNYGSPQADEQIVPVKSVQLSPDRTAITLSLPVETYPIGMVYEINLGDLTGTEGDRLLHNEAWYTVNQIPK